MPDISFDLVDPKQLEEIQQAERPPLHIRWWVVLVAVLLCSAQAVLNLSLESRYSPIHLIVTQISVIAFGLLVVLTLVLNPLMRLTRLVEPFNRGEIIALFASMFVSAGISSFGLVDQLIPLVATPFNPHWNVPQRGWDTDIVPYLNPNLYITNTAVIEQFREGFATREGLWHRIPWVAWAKPLALWMVFVFAIYLMFYSLSILLYDTWARREKLVFPLARLPEDMIHDEGATPGALPSITRSGLFWISFLSVFVLLSYNTACQAEWLRGLEPITFGIEQRSLMDMLDRSIFDGIAEANGPHFLVFMFLFTAVGIGFLLPLEISRSLWAYHLFAMFLFMVAIWCAVAPTVMGFRTDGLWVNNFVSALGAGGLLAFSAAYLAKLAHDQWTGVKECGQRLRGWQFIKRFLRGFGWGGLLFLLSTIVAIGWLRWAGVSIHWGIGFLAVVILVTVGLMRVVAEGGVCWFDIHTGPFHLANLVGGVKLIPAAILAPLMSIYSVLFLDIKTYMAPAVLNSFSMQEETRASRRAFHLVVVIAILVTVLVSVVAILYMAYEVGADSSRHVLFARAPQRLMDQTQRLVSGAVGDKGEFLWVFYVLGAGWVILSMLMRRRFFWWLHPIGFVMMVNPLMSQLWLSFFTGWLCKKLAIKYGGRHTFAKLRPLFIGLIFGELMACFLWSVSGQLFGLEDVWIDITYRYFKL